MTSAFRDRICPKELEVQTKDDLGLQTNQCLNSNNVGLF